MDPADAARAANRCRNCGKLGHYTHECEDFGPMFWETGKTRADYAEQDAEIMRLVAQDIMVEHAADEEERQRLLTGAEVADEGSLG